MRAYKFLLDNYKAMHGDFRYTMGETYIHNGDIELCEAGFHASKKIRDAIQYCSGSHLVEVELGGRIVEGLDKVVASEITIIRELDLTRELETLARNEHWWVRRAVARNPNTPANILETLAGDKDEDVRCGVAENLNTSVELLETLAGDKKGEVRWSVAQNPNTSIEILKTLAGDQCYNVRRAVVKNPNTTVNILEILAGDKNEEVRCAVAYDPNTPTEILETLAGDKCWDVRRAANSKLKERK